MSPRHAARHALLAFALAVLTAPAAAGQAFPPFVVAWTQTMETSFNSVDFSPDGQHVAAGANRYSAGQVFVWTAAGQPTLAATLGADVNAVAFTPDGAALVAAHAGGSCQPNGGCSGFGNELSRWAVPAGGLLGRQPYPQAYLSLQFSPDGQTFAGGNRYAPLNFNAVRFHHPVTLDSVGFLPAVTATEVAFSPDGARLVTGGFENLQYTSDARVWDVSTGSLLLELPHRVQSRPYMDETPDAVAYSPDGQYIATGGWGGAGTTVILWNASDGSLARRFDARTEPGADCGPYGLGTHVAFSPNGRYLAGATSCEPFSDRTDLVVRFWDVQSGELVRAYGMPGYFGVRGMGDFALSPTQNQMVFAYASGMRSGTIVVADTDLDLAGGVTTGNEPPALPAGFSLSAPRPNPLARGSATLTLSVAEAQHVSAVALDALGRQIAVLFDGHVRPGAPHQLSLEAAGRPAGTYVVRVTGETFAGSRLVAIAP